MRRLLLAMLFIGLVVNTALSTVRARTPSPPPWFRCLAKVGFNGTSRSTIGQARGRRPDFSR